MDTFDEFSIIFTTGHDFGDSLFVYVFTESVQKRCTHREENYFPLLILTRKSNLYLAGFPRLQLYPFPYKVKYSLLSYFIIKLI